MKGNVHLTLSHETIVAVLQRYLSEEVFRDDRKIHIKDLKPRKEQYTDTIVYDFTLVDHKEEFTDKLKGTHK